MSDVKQVLSSARNYTSYYQLDKSASELDIVSQLHSDLVRKQLFEHLRKALGVGLGVGAAARGLKGLAGVTGQSAKAPLSAPTPVNVVRLPRKSEEGREKVANKLRAHPAYYPGMTLAGMGGAYGGWKILDYILDKRRQEDVDAELAKAKQEYERVLTTDPKLAADGSLEKDLDLLADKAVKEGAWSGIKDMAGQASGVYLTGALLTALLAGRMGYNHSKKKQRRTVLENAQKQRAKGQSTPTVYIE